MPLPQAGGDRGHERCGPDALPLALGRDAIQRLARAGLPRNELRDVAYRDLVLELLEADEPVAGGGLVADFCVVPVGRFVIVRGRAVWLGDSQYRLIVDVARGADIEP